ncbi:MAG: oligosaccharide repeat unit polymerase [Acidobacteria bacterium]|nr:oligosaccharide repeat unit polymerase [Acidobacteriota bacterium]MCA1639130.1 oligosaccharide repeat unit polymerase [Acidobacteriota bacterium]
MHKSKFKPAFLRNRDTALLLPVLIIGALILLSGFSFLIIFDDTINPFKQMYLMPWVVLLGIVIAAPNVYLIYKGRFNFFHPLVFAAWSYFIPAFFVGGLLLAAGLSQPFYLTFVEDERYNLPLTFVYIILGYGGLTIGFFLPYGKKIADKVNTRLPVWDWKPQNIYFPGILLLFIGIGNSIIAFGLGILGYQKVDAIGAYDGLIFLLTLLWLEASFLLWLSVFRNKTYNITHVLIIVLILATSLTKSAFQGNRGSLFQLFILIACAFILSGRRIEIRHRVFGACLLVLAIVIGMIYGTTFRNVKQTEARIGIEEYTENIGQTFDKLLDQDLTDNLSEGISALTERIEGVSSVAVVVSNYEKLEPFEESYGLKNNILIDSIYFFIPRPLWKDKPVGSEPRKYADLYFNYSENSFAITPMGDLLRNFGPVGVPLGMMLLGFILRIIYVSLIENQKFSFWRTTLFYMLLTSVSYEGFYGTIIPYMIKYGFISVVGIVLIWFFQPKAIKTIQVSNEKTYLMNPLFKS